MGEERIWQHLCNADAGVLVEVEEVENADEKNNDEKNKKVFVGLYLASKRG